MPASSEEFEVDYCGRRHLRWVWRVYNGTTRLLKSGVMQVLCFHAAAWRTRRCVNGTQVIRMARAALCAAAKEVPEPIGSASGRVAVRIRPRALKRVFSLEKQMWIESRVVPNQFCSIHRQNRHW